VHEQTGRNFHTCFKEHIQAIKTNKPNSRFAQHKSDTIEKTMEIPHVNKALTKYMGTVLHTRS
jgi:hypothetical protein